MMQVLLCYAVQDIFEYYSSTVFFSGYVLENLLSQDSYLWSGLNFHVIQHIKEVRSSLGFFSTIKAQNLNLTIVIVNVIKRASQ